MWNPPSKPLPSTIKINDNRTINPASGQPFKKIGAKSVEVDPSLVQRIVAHAKSQGIDPNTALAVGLQETNLGKEDENIGHILKGYWNKIPANKMSEEDENVYGFVNALKDKMALAQRLGKKDEPSILQAYNGYGKVFPNTETDVYHTQQPSFYEIPVSKDKPLDLSQNPAYGKTVISLRDELLKKNPAIQQIVQDTPAFQMPATKPDEPIVTPKGNVLVKVKKSS